MLSPVIVRPVASYEDAAALDAAVEAVFAALPAEKQPTPASRVLLKPNLLARHAPDKAVTTHPALLRAVVAALRRQGVTDILLADSPGGLYTPARMRALYEGTGMTALAKELGIALYDACKSVTVPAATGGLVREFELIEPVVQRDYLIDLPKMKTHVMTGASLSVKNLFGCIPGLKKAEWHTRFPDKERFGEMLTDLCRTVQPALTILDGVVGMEGDGPSGGSPRPLGLVLGGADPFLVDLAACRIMGIEPERVPYLAAGIRRGLCPAEFPAQALDGDETLLRPAPFRLPASYGAGDTDFARHARGPVAWVLPRLERWAAPRPVVETAKCIGCGRCAEICPRHTIELNKTARIRPADCIRCFCCHEMCPVQAIQVKRLPLFRHL